MCLFLNLLLPRQSISEFFFSGIAMCIISKVGRFSDRNSDLNSKLFPIHTIEMVDSGIFSGILVEKQPNLLILLFEGF